MTTINLNEELVDQEYLPYSCIDFGEQTCYNVMFYNSHIHYQNGTSIPNSLGYFKSGQPLTAVSGSIKIYYTLSPQFITDENFFYMDHDELWYSNQGERIKVLNLCLTTTDFKVELYNYERHIRLPNNYRILIDRINSIGIRYDSLTEEEQHKYWTSTIINGTLQNVFQYYEPTINSKIILFNNPLNTTFLFKVFNRVHPNLNMCMSSQDRISDSDWGTVMLRNKFAIIDYEEFQNNGLRRIPQEFTTIIIVKEGLDYYISTNRNGDDIGVVKCIDEIRIYNSPQSNCIYSAQEGFNTLMNPYEMIACLVDGDYQILSWLDNYIYDISYTRYLSNAFNNYISMRNNSREVRDESIWRPVSISESSEHTYRISIPRERSDNQTYLYKPTNEEENDMELYLRLHTPHCKNMFPLAVGARAEFIRAFVTQYIEQWRERQIRRNNNQE